MTQEEKLKKLEAKAIKQAEKLAKKAAKKVEASIEDVSAKAIEKVNKSKQLSSF